MQLAVGVVLFLSIANAIPTLQPIVEGQLASQEVNVANAVSSTQSAVQSTTKAVQSTAKSGFSLSSWFRNIKAKISGKQTPAMQDPYIDMKVPQKSPMFRSDRGGNYASIGSGLALTFDFIVSEVKIRKDDGLSSTETLIKTIQTSKFFTNPCDVATMSDARIPASLLASASQACATFAS